MLDEAWSQGRLVREGDPEFLKQPGLVEVVRGLEAAPDVRDALTTAGIDTAQWPAYVAALRRLADTDMIAPRTTAACPGGPA